MNNTTSNKGISPMVTSKNTETDISSDVRNFLTKHQEVLIITADPDFILEGESTIAVYSKLLDNEGAIAPMLVNILQNLIATIAIKNGQQCNNIEDKAAINT